ncbi:MAG: 23S rRNA (adenine(2503)-C(2))-methyltransferase RlmN [Candidatus Omnitrophica bacterium]|nr:23S rRNA (adenine(2503)-C(2))-methyltransferase RlmN [Candidatus Omnitrophota bacterium]
MSKRNIKDLGLKELEEILNSWGHQRFHAKQIHSWIYVKGAVSFDAMSDLALDLRERLKESFSFFELELAEIVESSDGTKKFLFKLKDNNLIEAVTIPAERRITGCISSQVGCKYACCFCASGMLGFKRNLTASEIIEEVLYLKYNLKDERISHIVFMGTGEPLDNYDNLLKAIRIINAKDGIGIGARRITISTCGIIPGIKRLAGEDLQVELSISLHAASDKIRSQLVPLNKQYPLKSLISACKEYIRKTNRQITFEYVLINDLNSDLQNARNLSTILKDLKLAKVNLIPANPIKELKIEPPEKSEILKFKDYLVEEGVNVTLRKPRGSDIEASCGQLRLRYGEKQS